MSSFLISFILFYFFFFFFFFLMRWKVLCQQLKVDRWINEGVAEYQKRLPHHWRVDIEELPTRWDRIKQSPTEKIFCLDASGAYSFSEQPRRGPGISQCGDGSSTFAESVRALELGGVSTIVLLLGEPEGLPR